MNCAHVEILKINFFIFSTTIREGKQYVVQIFNRNFSKICILFLICNFYSCTSTKNAAQKFNIPEGYLQQPSDIPAFWLSTVDEVNNFLRNRVHKGQVKIIGTSAGGRPIRAVFYGKPRHGNGTTTFSGSLGFRNVAAYRGPDHSKTVYLGMAAIHGGEFEGIVGIVNLISVIETGKDLRGKEWPKITAAMADIDRLILIPIMNPDGRARIPLRMELYRGTSNTVDEYLNTGGKLDGTLIGWPQVKEFIPLDFKTTSFPGGYPNDAGVNIQHDDFLGKIQPETKALFDLVAREKPDLILNMHSGAPPKNYFISMYRPLGEPVLRPIFDSLYKSIMTALTLQGLKRTRDVKIESDPKSASRGVYNIDGALDFHCGALSVVVESPEYSFSDTNPDGKIVRQTPDMLVDASLICHQEAIKFLLETGGRSKWIP